MSLLQINNLCVEIAGQKILHDVSLAIAPGERVAITGQSGSGKSMTALAVMGLLPPGARARGQIFLNGEDVLGANERRLCALRGRAMGMVFQEPMNALNPVQTVGAQVSEALRIHDGISRKQALARARDILDRVGFSLPMGRYAHELSGGQRQRVVIAMAIALRPALLIADEPTTALDVMRQAQILGLLHRLCAQDQIGLLFITHNLGVVGQMADRVAIMQSGRIIEQTTVNAGFSALKEPYSRALLAASRPQAQRPLLPAQPRTGEIPLLKVRNLHCTYVLPRRRLIGAPDCVQAVKDVSFDIHKGARVGLVGQSGCGKSTLARAILGLSRVSSGKIMLNGADISQMRDYSAAVRRKIQAVFQDPYGSFNPRHPIGRTISEPLALFESRPDSMQRDSMIAQTLRTVGLDPEDAIKCPHQFSGGQRQRIAIARALIIRPELIVFDEAVSALDVRVRQRILDLLASLCESHALTYLFISHDLDVVRSVTDQILVMRAGEIVEHGSTQDVLDAPKHAYTKALVAAQPNLR